MNSLDLSLIKRAQFGRELFITNVENDSDGKPIYIGLAPKGTADSASLWVIEKITYTNGYFTSSRLSDDNAIWNDRASLTYT